MSTDRARNESLAFVFADAPPGNLRGPTVRVRRVVTSAPLGASAALLRCGPAEAVISDPAALRELAVAFDRLAREAEAAWS